uniref:C2H2-type domain-containing protein n=1 Tax=Bubo bubo TaxID=30461 RepID=A0A8C0ED89_BUBBB
YLHSRAFCFLFSFPALGEGVTEWLGSAQLPCGLKPPQMALPFSSRHQEHPAGSKEEQTPTGQGDGVKNTHAATSKPVARAERGTYKCPDCRKTFKDFSSLISLHRIHKGERPYKCLQCGECFSHSSSLSTHRRTHTGEKPSSCSDCGESFTQKQTLILHQRIHPGEMPNRCQQCQKTFRTSSHLTMHQRIHAQEKATTQPRRSSRKKEQKCADCGKVFGCRSNLNRHQRIHTGEKPYNTCGKRFSFMPNLLVHQRTHTGERPYACSHCGKTFREGYCLRRHQESIHNGESSEGLNHLSHRAHP